MNWDRAYTLGWVAIIAILIGYELFAVSQGPDSHYPPLTWVVVKYVPYWVTMPFLTWLWYHFLVRYLDRVNYLTKI